MKQYNLFATFFTSFAALLIININMVAQLGYSNSKQPIARFSFNGSIDNTMETEINILSVGELFFDKGIEGQSLSINPNTKQGYIIIDSKDICFDNKADFSIQFWIKSLLETDKRAVIMSTKKIYDNSLIAQKKQGWLLSISNGTFAWNIGSGNRRITYARDNGNRMPLNDGQWHQLTLTYSSKKEEMRLYYDGINRAIYNINDGEGFNFSSGTPLVVGWTENGPGIQYEILPEIIRGKELLQKAVDEFDKLGLGMIEQEDFLSLIVDPEELFRHKLNTKKQSLVDTDTAQFIESIRKVKLQPVLDAVSALMKNAYTVHQVRDFMEVAPLFKIYSLDNGKVIMDEDMAGRYALKEKLCRPDFDMDELIIWDRILLPGEIFESYSDFSGAESPVLSEKIASLTAACWNIHHGGIHYTIENDGWDSRMRIVEMLKKEEADVIMMQETYSSGDFIAAELGYYFVTTADWDYLNQGSNISVISRYPIKEIFVPDSASFMNVAAKVAISETQEIYVMSNWYGMNKFPHVFEFHNSRFKGTDTVPVLFAGDFNAVPHTDGGKSPASKIMLDEGFTDAFRSIYPDVGKFPGFTHRSGKRIDQLYYKGKALKNTSIRVISSWPGGFPSDHYLIISDFDIDY